MTKQEEIDYWCDRCAASEFLMILDKNTPEYTIAYEDWLILAQKEHELYKDKKKETIKQVVDLIEEHKK